MSNGGRRLSVIRELHVLASSVESLRALAQQKLDGSCHADSIHDLAVVTAGGLHVLRDRIILLERVLVGVANPALILCPSNEVDASRSGPFIMAEWSPEEQVQRMTAELRGACYRQVLERLPAKTKPDDKRSS